MWALRHLRAKLMPQGVLFGGERQSKWHHTDKERHTCLSFFIICLRIHHINYTRCRSLYIYIHIIIYIIIYIHIHILLRRKAIFHHVFAIRTRCQWPFRVRSCQTLKFRIPTMICHVPWPAVFGCQNNMSSLTTLKDSFWKSLQARTIM